MHASHRPVPILAITLAITFLAACGTGSKPSGATEASISAPSSSPTLPPDAAPTELQGRWSTLLAPGDNATLTIEPTGYSIVRALGHGNGAISVHGDQIEFSRVQNCPDVTGTYRWKISGRTLTFTPVGPDPCPRAFVLKDHKFTKLGS